jgi:hypothetical protein
MRWLLIAAVLALVGVGSAWALTPPQRAVMLGAKIINSGGGGGAGCVSPNAPDGSVDLSKCSNAYYVAIIF